MQCELNQTHARKDEGVSAQDDSAPLSPRVWELRLPSPRDSDVFVFLIPWSIDSASSFPKILINMDIGEN